MSPRSILCLFTIFLVSISSIAQTARGQSDADESQERNKNQQEANNSGAKTHKSESDSEAEDETLLRVYSLEHRTAREILRILSLFNAQRINGQQIYGGGHGDLKVVTTEDGTMIVRGSREAID